MREYKYYLFDLDGTITASEEGIINSVVHALERMGVEHYDRSELRKFIGPPLDDSFKRYFELNDEESERAVRFYREYFTERGMYENEVYEGVPELLKRLKKNNKKLVVATSKPEVFTVRILKYFGLFEYFDTVAGATLDGSRTKKEDVIRYALEKSGVNDPALVVMIGDREHDIIGAKKNGLDSIGVTYGYGSREELEAAGATYIADRPGDIQG